MTPRGWFGLWSVAFLMTALGYAWSARGQSLLGVLAAVSATGLLVSLFAVILQTRR